MSRTAIAPPSLPKAPPIIGSCPALTSLLLRARRAAASNLPVVVSGESGTGKELLARFLHDNSPRAQAPYVVVNCAAFPRELIDSELFGYERGAFTGARESHMGWFQSAHQGTLVLDEIGELPLELQPKLLRVLEDGVVTRVGSRKGTALDVRVVAVTNRDLASECETRQFRLDLYHRLAGVALTLPALRERWQDLPTLIRHFAAQAALAQGLLAATEAMPPSWPSLETCQALTAYNWPGNLRQLRHVVARTVALHGYPFSEADLLSEVPQPQKAIIVSGWPQAISRAADAPVGQPPLGVPEWLNLKDKTWAQVEAELIRYQLAATHGNRRQAARALGISRTTLYERLRHMPASEAAYP